LDVQVLVLLFPARVDLEETAAKLKADDDIS
jgi:hypothetical protein